MIEDNKDIDNLFQSAIEPYTMEPSDKVWTGLDAELAKKKDTGAGWWNNRLWYSLLAVVVLMASLAVYEFFTPFSYSNKTNGNIAQANEKASAAALQNTDKKENTSSVKSSDNSNQASASSDKNAQDASRKNSESVVGKNNSSIAKAPVTPSYKNSVATPEALTASAAKAGTAARRANNSAYTASTQTTSPTADNKVAASSPETGNGVKKEGNPGLNRQSPAISDETNNPSASVSDNPTASQPSTGNASTAGSGETADEGNAGKSGKVSNNNQREVASTSSGSEATSTQPATEAGNGNNNEGSSAAPSQNDNAAKSDQKNADGGKDGNTTANAAENQPKAADTAAQPAATGSEADANAAASILPLKEVKRRFSLDVFYAPEMAHGSFNNTSTGNSATTTSEKFNYSFNTGTMFRFDINDHWSVALGCTYSTLDYSTSVTTAYVVPPVDTTGNGGPFGHGGGFGGGGHGNHDSSNNNSFLDSSYFDHFYSSSGNGYDFHNPCGGDVHFNGAPPVVPPNSSSKPGDVIAFITSTRIHLEYINVPLTVSFKVSHKRLDYYTSAGIAMSYLVNKKATINVGDAYSETTSDISGLHTMAYSYLFSIGARYHFYKGLSFYLEPSLRGTITSVTDDSSQGFYPYYFGVNTGLSIRF